MQWPQQETLEQQKAKAGFTQANEYLDQAILVMQRIPDDLPKPLPESVSMSSRLRILRWALYAKTRED